MDKTKLVPFSVEKAKAGAKIVTSGFDVPKTWAEYNKKVFITTK